MLLKKNNVAVDRDQQGVKQKNRNIQLSEKIQTRTVHNVVTRSESQKKRTVVGNCCANIIALNKPAGPPPQTIESTFSLIS